MSDDDELIRLLSAGPPTVAPRPEAVAAIVAGAARRRRRRQRGAMVGGMAAVVVAVTAISLAVTGLSHRGGSTSQDPAASSTVSVTSSPVVSRSPISDAGPSHPVPSSVPSAAVVPTHATTASAAAPGTSASVSRPFAFRSPTGNIACSSPDQGTTVNCHITRVDTVPGDRPDDCPAADWGHTLTVDAAHGGRIVCDGTVSVATDGPVLAYDTGETLGVVDCESRTTGIICRVASGAGIHLTSAAVDVLAGSVGSDAATRLVSTAYFAGEAVAAGYTVGSARSATCSPSTASSRADARRCRTADDTVLDPCFLRPDATRAVCPEQADDTTLTLLTVTADVSTGGTSTRAPAWALDLADDTSCRHVPDQWTSLADGHSASYACTDGRYVVGTVDQSGPTWTVQIERVGSDVATVAVTVAHL